MPVCKKCGKQWTWGQTLKKMFTVSVSMNCPYCGSTQYMTARSRKRSSLFAFVAPVVMFITVFFDLNLWQALILFLGAAGLLLALGPFAVELGNEEEPLW